MREILRLGLERGGIDWVTVTSSAIGRALVKLYGERLRNTQLVSISPLTTQTLRELGYEIAAEATDATMQGVIDAILNSASA